MWYVRLDDGRCGILFRRDSRSEYEYMVDLKGDKTASGASHITRISKDEYDAYQPPKPVETTKPRTPAKKATKK